jgi:type I restriction enzyme S subunit
MKRGRFLRLGDHAKFRNGLNFSRANRGTGCVLIGVPDFQDRFSPAYDSLKEIDPSGIACEDDYLQKGDIIFVRSNGNKALVGRSLYIDKTVRALFSGFCIRARIFGDNLDPKFCAYFTKSKYFKRSIASSAGTNINNLNQDILSDVLVPFFDKDRQLAIADLLGNIDAKIELNRQINCQLEGMAKSLYDYWFIQFDFPITAAQAVAMGKSGLEGKPYRSSGGKMVYNETLKREIPACWKCGNLERLGNIVGGSTPSTRKPEYFTDDGTPWITPNDLSENKGNRFIDHGASDVTPEGIKAASLKLLPAGTVLLSSRAPIGYLAIARKPATTNQGFKSFIPGEEFSTEYVYFTLKHFMKLIKANASGSKFKEISGGTLKAVRIPFPDPKLVTKFTEIASVLSQQQSILEQQNKHLAELRDWLLPMLMNGQITVT